MEGTNNPVEERDFLWKKCKQLYNTISNNGTISSAVFRQSFSIAEGVFNKGQMNLKAVMPWFSAMADFLDWMETAMKQKGEIV